MKKIIILILLVFISCTNEDKPLNEAMEQTRNLFSKSDFELFLLKEENTSVAPYLNKLKFRNVVFEKEDSILIKYFNKKGITNLDDMSSIIFVSLHRKYKLEKINLQEQIKEKINYRKRYSECELLNLKKLQKNDKYVKGDTIQIRMNINKIDNRAYPIQCLNMHPDWKFDDSKDLLIKGVVLNKYHYDYIEENKFLKIRILELNKKNILAPTKILKIGDELEIVLNYDIIEPAKQIDKE